jgi:hypothetical protein
MKRPSVEAGLRGFEKRLGIDRQGRSVWVWLVPPGVGVAAGVIAALMPGIPDEGGWALRVLLGIFALVTMTLIAVIYMISFDNDRNQQADPGE